MKNVENYVKQLKLIGAHGRQGDVTLTRVDSIPANAKEIPAVNGKVILALGEATGHHHFLDASVATLVEVDSQSTEDPARRFVTLKEEADLIHQTHGVETYPPGNYEVIVGREYSPEGIHRVKD